MEWIGELKLYRTHCRKECHIVSVSVRIDLGTLLNPVQAYACANIPFS